MRYLSIVLMAILGWLTGGPGPMIHFNGNVLNSETREAVEYCKIRAHNLKTGKTVAGMTDENGRFSLLLEPGKVRISYSCTGMDQRTDSFFWNPAKDTTITKDVLLNKTVYDLKEVTVAGSKAERRMADMAPVTMSAPVVVKDTKGPGKLIKRSAPRGMSEYSSGGVSSLGISAARGELSDDRVRYSSADAGGIKAGTLTAGEINDFAKWTLWNDLSAGELKQHIARWGIQPKNRYCVQITNEERFPIADALVQLKDTKGHVVWESHSDNTGKAELWAGLFDTTGRSSDRYSILTTYKGKSYVVERAAIFSGKINRIILPAGCKSSNNLDILFTVDATGSMGDEIRYLQEELYDVIQRVKQNNSGLDIRMGSVFYRDKGDAYLTVKQDLTGDISKVMTFIRAQAADGGGDEPEAVDAAMEASVNGISWRAEARSRIMFLVLDASPHGEQESVDKIKKYTAMAATKGIRIVPVVCSGIDKPGEYLMRSIALATNGNYIFLTDHSGVGDSHLAPSTDKYSVETLNVLLGRLIQQYVFMPECNQSVKLNSLDSTGKDQADSMSRDTSLLTNPDVVKDTSVNRPTARWILKYYPNPCRGILQVDLIPGVTELYIADLNGKLLMKIPVEQEQNHIEIDMSAHPSGIYFLRYCVDGTCKSGKFVLMR